MKKDTERHDALLMRSACLHFGLMLQIHPTSDLPRTVGWPVALIALGNSSNFKCGPIQMVLWMPNIYYNHLTSYDLILLGVGFC